MGMYKIFTVILLAVSLTSCAARSATIEVSQPDYDKGLYVEDK